MKIDAAKQQAKTAIQTIIAAAKQLAEAERQYLAAEDKLPGRKGAKRCAKK